MEINAANSQVSSTKKKWMKTADSVSYLQTKYKKLPTTPFQKKKTIKKKKHEKKPQKTHKVRNEIIRRYVSVKFPLKVAKFQTQRRDFTHS